MAPLPTGTITFLFTDIEGSTRLWEREPEAMRTALARHDAILRNRIEARGGTVFKTVGDAFCAAFADAVDGVGAALDLLRALQMEAWPHEIGTIRVRAALHTGAAEERDGDYFGQPLNRVARLLSAGYGGQLLLSQVSYDLVRDHLPEGATASDLGEHRLRDLTRPERVYQIVANGLPADFPDLKSLSTRPNNLPLQATTLIGRETELSAIAQVLGEPNVRLVTLTGPGGIGKTRLAVQAGSEMLDAFQDGVFIVALEETRDHSLLPSIVLHALALREEPAESPTKQLMRFLREKNLLLLLDNFEQVIDATPFVAEMLASCPRLKVLVTSRTILHLKSERAIAIPPLSFPEKSDRHAAGLAARLSEYEAVQLFLARAVAAMPTFRVTNDNAPAVAEVCFRLGGSPLAIELAAARLRLLSPEAMLAKLSSQLSFLKGGPRDSPQRHRAIRDTIAWSYDLLEDAERSLLRRLSVFAGGFTAEAADAVAGNSLDSDLDVLDGLESLLDKSLARRQEEVSEGRFALLEPIAEYGHEQLVMSGEGELVSGRHLDYFLGLAEDAASSLNGPARKQCLDRLERDLPNFRVAADRASATGNHDAELRLTAALGELWLYRGHCQEGLRRVESALVRAERCSPSARARALVIAGYMANELGHSDRRTKLLEEALSLGRQAGDRKAMADALVLLEFVGTDSAREDPLSLYRELDDKAGMAWCLLGRGQQAVESRGDLTLGSELLREALSLATQAGDRRRMAMSLLLLAGAERDGPSKVRLYEQSLALFQELGEPHAFIYELLGYDSIAQGDFLRARTRFLRSFELSRANDAGNRPLAELLRQMVAVLVAQRYLISAARLLGAASTVLQELERTEGQRDTTVASALERDGAEVREGLGEHQYDALFSAGQALSAPEALRLAMEVCGSVDSGLVPHGEEPTVKD